VSNVHRREPFRQHSYLSDVAIAVIVGAGIAGYGYAVDVLTRAAEKR
jgi:3-dehydroquinate dehydratase-2